MKKYIIYSLCFWFFFSSCNDWLDLKPNSQTETDEMFTSYEGFKSALTGCYIKMRDRRLYGEYLTMSHLESLARLWYVRSTDDVVEALAEHDYEHEKVKGIVADIYSGLYNVIVQANTIIEHARTNGSCIEDSVSLALIEGEAYAIRAFCHLDVLRLFGQMPKNPMRKVSLPYAEEVLIKKLPPYYDYAAFCTKIENDLLMAEKILEKLDPVIERGMAYSGSDDVMHNYRGLDLNYYAVKVLQARFYLYINQPDKAYAAAKAVYDVMPVKLSGVEDMQRKYFASPTECLFALSNNALIDYSVAVLGNPGERVGSGLYITQKMYNELYEGVSGEAHIRDLSWNKNTLDNFGSKQCVVKKYYYNTSESHEADVLLMKLQIVPMIRMCEVYLILMETTMDLDEANVLYVDYMMAHNVGDVTKFASLEKVKEFVMNEIRREFFAEGHMFYAYKRQGVQHMMFTDEDNYIGENEYVLPLPDTEYDPITLNQ